VTAPVLVRPEAAARTPVARHVPHSLLLGRFALRSRRRLICIGVAVVLLALAAGIDGGRLLLTVDRPITEWALRSRSPDRDRVFLWISFWGSTKVVLLGGAALALAALPRCRAVAGFVVVATLTRPVLEFILKAAVDRQRPDLGRLVQGNGPSFPSGHVLASAVLWGLVPVVIALYVDSRLVWRISSAISVLVVVAVGLSRVYLGVHWFSDVVAGCLVAALMLAAFEFGYQRVHCRRKCDLRHTSPDSGRSPMNLDVWHNKE